MKHMTEVGIRELKQNASAVVREAASGESLTITDRGRPVATIGPLRQSRLHQLIEAGHARPPRASWADITAPEPGPALSGELAAMRSDERY